MVLSSPITSSEAERTTSVHQRRGSGVSVRSGMGSSWGVGREKRDGFVSHYRKVHVGITKRNCFVSKSPKEYERMTERAVEPGPTLNAASAAALGARVPRGLSAIPPRAAWQASGPPPSTPRHAPPPALP